MMTLKKKQYPQLQQSQGCMWTHLKQDSNFLDIHLRLKNKLPIHYCLLTNIVCVSHINHFQNTYMEKRLHKLLNWVSCNESIELILKQILRGASKLRIKRKDRVKGNSPCCDRELLIHHSDHLLFYWNCPSWLPDQYTKGERESPLLSHPDAFSTIH